jgi:hypothetical protein
MEVIMSNLEIINTMLQETPESQLPEIIDFLQCLRRKNDTIPSNDVQKRLSEWDAFVEAVNAASDEETADFERVRFDREPVL